MPEFASDFNDVIKASETELLRRNQVDREQIQAANGTAGMEMYDDMGLPESQAKEIKY